MTLIKTGWVFYLFVLFFVCAYEPPEVIFQALKPKGFRVIIPDVADNRIGTAFRGIIYRPLTDIGILLGDLELKRDGRLMYEDLETPLKIGDVLYYQVCAGYLKDNLTFIVRALEDPAEQSTTAIHPINNPKPSSAGAGSPYEFPEVSIQALKPKGLRVSIPDDPKIGLFAVQAFVNQPISKTSNGTLGYVMKSTDGRWVYEDLKTQLKIGDVINNRVTVWVKYFTENLSFTVKALEDPAVFPTIHQKTTTTTQRITASATSSPDRGDCEPSLTLVRGGSVCSGQTIFEDHFDELREDVWQIEQYIPTEHPEYPFVSYQRATVSVSNGILRIAPRLQQNMPGYDDNSILSGTLNLFKGCTGSANECSIKASGASILPPVVGGRITSKGLAFTYGTVHIRAKLPQGDWLYPEILLEPFRKKYGEQFASGVINIARARGNKALNIGITTMGNKVLYGGPIMDSDCRQYLISETKLNNGNWGDDFHVYSVNWTPEHITLSVDDQEWARIEPMHNGLEDLFPPNCRNLPREFLAVESKMAPFDDYFYITLGVAAGGITEFRDDLYTQNFKDKPWRNQGRKAALNFWEDVDSWLPTWTNPELLVDYVKVVAL